MDSGTLRLQLLRAVELRDAALFESSLAALCKADLTDDLADTLGEVLTQSWHTVHEDVARALQTLQHPSSVESLFAAAHAQQPYLEYDECFGLARRCTWALADIGTPEARQRLIDLAAGDNAIIAGYAQKRLDHWDIDGHRRKRR
ncbi:MAG: hypothetical protein IPJ34_19405 [Myxococcales bacterium]|nr:hypothetical protein [Myxococcales bacterium]